MRLRVAVDAGGGDAGPAPVVAGALEVAAEFDILLVGPTRQVRAELKRRPPPYVQLLDAPDVVGMAEGPLAATWRTRRSSLLVAADAVARGHADAMVTPGNTGAAVLAVTARLRRLPGVLHPALATLLPSPGGTPTVFLDVGATTACPPAWLVQFAVLGAAYARARLGLARPRIGLLSNGHEDGKGGRIQRDAHAALAAHPGYVGQVEAYDLLGDRVDVVVADGFTGDVAIKTYERTLSAAAEVAKSAAEELFGGEVPDRVRALSAAIRPTLGGEPGGALLGLNGVCVICHGVAGARDIAGAVRLAGRCVEADVVGHLSATRRPQQQSPTMGMAHGCAAF